MLKLQLPLIGLTELIKTRVMLKRQIDSLRSMVGEGDCLIYACQYIINIYLLVFPKRRYWRTYFRQRLRVLSRYELVDEQPNKSSYTLEIDLPYNSD